MRNRVHLLHSCVCEESKATRLYERNYVYRTHTSTIAIHKMYYVRNIRPLNPFHPIFVIWFYLSALKLHGFCYKSKWNKRNPIRINLKTKTFRMKKETSDFELHVTKHFTACSSHRFMNKRKQIYLSTGSASKCVSMQR